MSRQISQFAICLGLALLALVSGSGCGIIDALPLAVEEKTVYEEFKTGDTPQIVVDTFNGSIDVSPGEAGQVVVDVTKEARGIDGATASANLDAIELSMVQEANKIRITAKRLDSRVQCGASVVIAVPPGSKVTLESSNGAITCEGIRGGVEAESSNGKLQVIEGTGAIKLETSNGTIEVAATDAVVDAQTSNGRVAFEGTLADGKHRFKSSNGPIKLALPADSEFRFEGSTSNSRIECDFPIKSEGRKRRTRLKGVVGDDPQCLVSASTSNGSIDVRKAVAEKRDKDE